MAWGVFKKIKDFGKKVISGVQQGAKFVQEKVLPGARKVLDVVAPFVPYGDEIKNIVDTVDKYSKPVSKGELPDDVRDWVQSKLRV